MQTVPENGIVKALRRVMPYVAGFDYTIIAIIVSKLGISLFIPNMMYGIEHSAWIVLFEVFPTCGVILTAVVAAGLITASLSSFESDMSDISMIRKPKAQAERKAYLTAQISVCQTQRTQAIVFMVAYVVMVALPVTLGIDVTQGGGRIVALAFIVGEMLVPLLNMRTFSIVESTMNKTDIIKEVTYHSQRAAMQVIDGIAKRSKDGTISRHDKAALRGGRGGDIDAVLQGHTESVEGMVDGSVYVSLRSIITGVRDGDYISGEQERRYQQAVRIAREWRASGNQEINKHFKNGDRNRILVTQEMGGKIAARLSLIKDRRTLQLVNG